MGSSNSPHVMTLVNSIIGVSILAMPFCYKQCGVILASLILIFINLMTRLSCHYMLKSAIMTRRKNFEFLAFHAFGGSGKTAIELCIILLMIGTCIAFFVVMGDLGPAIISSLLNMEFSAALRPAVLIGLAVFVVLPLGMLRNVDSLSFICTLSFLFYLILVFKVFVESTDNLFSMNWMDEVNYWRPAGLLQCLPIFSMALSCQSQLFEIFDSVGNATLDRMNLIVKYAVDLCTLLYIAVGVFGYIAYYKTSMTGNLLMSFSESLFSEIIKLLFVLSVAVTFPLVIFPCRASLYSLLFKKAHVPHYELVTGGGNHIPEAQFKCITLFIITLSLVVGLLAPNIEIVLGLVGSTIGVVICLLFPPMLFIRISSKHTTEKILAQIMCMIGFFIMVMGTYANLYLSDSVANNDVQNWKPVEPLQVMETKVDVAEPPLSNLEPANVVKPEIINEIKDLPKLPDEGKKPSVDLNEKPQQIQNKAVPIVEEPKAVKEDKRIEPPVPLPPEALKKPENQPPPANKEIKLEDNKPPAPEPQIKNPIEEKPVAKANPDPIPVAASNSEQKIQSVKQSKKPLGNTNQKNSLPIPNKEDVQLKSDNLIPKMEDKSVKEAAKVENPVIQPVVEQPKEIRVQKQVSDLIKTNSPIPPLPILMNNNATLKKEIYQNKNPAGRDILENPKNPVERDKRDLYATNATLMKDNAAVADIASEVKDDATFVKTIVDNANANKACENTKQSDTSVDKKSEPGIEPKLKFDRDTVAENLADVKENLILAPSKLSDPALVLEQKLPEKELKANAANGADQMKPMLRELKAAEVKEADNSRKK